MNPQPEVNLEELVDAVMDGRATSEEQQTLEERLRTDSAAMDYFARRMLLHAELAEAVRPLRVELTQQRRLVIEGEGSQRQVVVGETREARFGGQAHPSLPPLERPQKHRGRFWLIAALAVLAAIAGVWFWLHGRNAGESAKLALRNSSFESDVMNANAAGYSETIQDWDDNFPCPDAGVCALEKWSKGRLKPHSGTNAVHLAEKRPAWLSQRLLFPDGHPLAARRGMVVEVSGWGYYEADREKRSTFSISLRHVASTHPAMVQYTAVSGDVALAGGEWKPFLVRLSLPADSLVKSVTHKEGGGRGKEKLDLEGRALALSLDNFYQPALYLDDVKIEIIAWGQDPVQ